MKTELTAKLINSLKPQAKDYWIHDTKVRGLVLRVRKTGGMTYALAYERGKTLTLGSAGKMDHLRARRDAEQILAQYKIDGIDPIKKRKEEKRKNEDKDDIYLGFLNKYYKPWLEQNLRTYEETYRNLVESFPELHKLKLTEIRQPVIIKWQLRRAKDGLKPWAIKRQLDDLKAMLNRAVYEFEVIPEYPLPVRRKGKKLDSNKRTRYLSTEEEKALKEALEAHGNEQLTAAVLLSLHTALRKRELFQLRWKDIKWDQNNIEVRPESAKTGQARSVPLSPEALSILTRMKDRKVTGINYIFCKPNGMPYKDMDTSWQIVLDSAKPPITDFVWHDLRHTAASRLLSVGGDLYTIAKILGHSSIRTTERYLHQKDEKSQELVSKLTAIG